MKNILLVDDDPLVLRIYRDVLGKQGFEVETANDGLGAVNALRTSRPDAVVLDLMMPRFTGVDVLKFIRSQANLASLPVIVLSNSYMDEIAGQAAKIGVQKALLKVRCSPPVLAEVINDVLAGRSGCEDSSQLLAVPTAEGSEASSGSQPQPREKADAAEFNNKARRNFIEGAPATCAAIRSLFQSFTNAPTEAERSMRLQDLYRKIHFVAAIAGIAQCHYIALLTSAFEALLMEAMDKPARMTPSLLQTIASSVDFLGTLFDQAGQETPDVPLSAQVLVVDDDPLSNHLATAALQRAHLQARSTENPRVALQWLGETRYDILLLDIEMPGLAGFEVCKQLRLMPGYEKTPVIYVTSHSDFESRIKGVLSGGNDLIAKPVFPMELAVKAVIHLLKRRLVESAPG